MTKIFTWWYFYVSRNSDSFQQHSQSPQFVANVTFSVWVLLLRLLVDILIHHSLFSSKSHRYISYRLWENLAFLISYYFGFANMPFRIMIGFYMSNIWLTSESWNFCSQIYTSNSINFYLFFCIIKPTNREPSENRGRKISVGKSNYRRLVKNIYW